MAFLAGGAPAMISLPTTGTALPPATAEIRERIASARARREPLRVVGGCSWLDAGRPVRAHARLDATADAGIVEYVPGDLTLTARAGTTLAELERATAGEHQWLPLDPFGSEAGTLGATVVTGSSGPLAHGFGAVRDNVLGVEIVTGRGEIVRAGGRVVKNVAGFDLTRLVIGSWGTLGVITEVSVRLRARPEVDRTLAVYLPEDALGTERTIAALRTASIAPIALQAVNASLARRLGIENRDAIIARLGGNERSVRGQQEALAAIGEVTEVSAALWRTLRGSEPPDALVMRVGGRASELGERWCTVRRALASARARATNGTGPEDILIHAWVGSGSIRIIAPRSAEPQFDDLLFALRLSPADARAIGERLTPPLWARLGAAAAAAPLAQRVRTAFDPDHVLNPGILGEPLP